MLIKKIAHKREQQHHVSTKLVTFWATKMASENGITNFAASRGWLFRFLQRFNITIRRKTNTGQIVPNDVSVKLYKFVKFNMQQRDIANMDETPIWADMPSATIIQFIDP